MTWSQRLHLCLTSRDVTSTKSHILDGVTWSATSGILYSRLGDQTNKKPPSLFQRCKNKAWRVMLSFVLIWTWGYPRLVQRSQTHWRLSLTPNHINQVGRTSPPSDNRRSRSLESLLIRVLGIYSDHFGLSLYMEDTYSFAYSYGQCCQWHMKDGRKIIKVL